MANTKQTVDLSFENAARARALLDPVLNQDAATKKFVDDGLALKYDASNPNNYQTASQVAATVAAVVNSAPAALDTLSELAVALGNDANFATTTATALGNRLRVDTPAQGLNPTQQTNAKTNISLQNVDNTSDAAKPISTATQTALNGKANLAGGNTFTGNQNFGAGLVNIPPAPLNLVNSAPGALRTQLTLVNGGGGAGAGSAMDFHTYDDQPTSTFPGARFAAIDDNFSAFMSFLTKIPGAPANTMVERMRITNDGRIGVGVVPAASARLQIDSTIGGFLMPRMTSAQRDAIATPATGLQVYDTTLGAVCTFNGSVWLFEIALASQNNQASTSATYANITELVSPTLPAGRYAFMFTGAAQSTLLATGVGFRLNGASISAINATWLISQAANGTAQNFQYSQIANTTDVTSTSVLTANADFPVQGFGVFSLSAASTVAAQIRSETGLIGVSVRINSALKIQRITG